MIACFPGHSFAIDDIASTSSATATVTDPAELAAVRRAFSYRHACSSAVNMASAADQLDDDDDMPQYPIITATTAAAAMARARQYGNNSSDFNVSQPPSQTRRQQQQHTTKAVSCDF